MDMDSLIGKQVKSVWPDSTYTHTIGIAWTDGTYTIFDATEGGEECSPFIDIQDGRTDVEDRMLIAMGVYTKEELEAKQDADTKRENAKYMAQQRRDEQREYARLHAKYGDKNANT